MPSMWHICSDVIMIEYLDLDLLFCYFISEKKAIFD